MPKMENEIYWVKGQIRPYGNKELKTKKEKMRNENMVEGQTWPYT